MKRTSNAFQLTYLAIMTAIVIVLQFAGSFIHLGTFSISPVLLPIVLGVVVGGPLSGLWLGLVFGVTVLATGDAALFLGINAFGTVLTVLLKGMLCGFFAGLTFKALQKVNLYFATLCAAVVCPLVNTGVFLIGTRLFFWEWVNEMAQGAGSVAWAWVFVALIGANFFFELIFNVVLSPAIIRLINTTNFRKYLK